MTDNRIDLLYFKYGNRLSSGVAELLYDKIEADPELAHFFVNTDFAGLREHMADLLCTLTGGPDTYKGQNLADAHADYKIDSASFDRVAGHLAAALEEVGIDDEDAGLVLTAVASYKPDIVTV